jgi:hypothetical protein
MVAQEAGIVSHSNYGYRHARAFTPGLEPVAAQKALDLPLLVQHNDPVLAGHDRQIPPLGHVDTKYQVALRECTYLN